MHRGIGFFLAVAAFCLAACSSSSSDVQVRVVSDLVAGYEATLVEVELFAGEPGPASTRRAHYEQQLFAGDSLARGVIAAAIRGVSSGTYNANVRIRRANGELLGQRPVTFDVRKDMTVTVIITADCQNVQCPNGGGTLTACLHGTCVDPRCSTETPQYCPENFICDDNTDCAGAVSECASSTCIANFCIDTPVVGECASDEYCARGEGCKPIDAPDDDDRALCGRICNADNDPCRHGYYACSVVEGRTVAVCTSFVAEPIGTTCGDARVCDNRGECVMSVPDAGVDAGPDAALDAAPDATADAAPDAAHDATPDAMPDASVDAHPIDAAPDADAPDMGPIEPEIDAAVDAAIDAAPDAEPAADAALPDAANTPDGSLPPLCDSNPCGSRLCRVTGPTSYQCYCDDGYTDTGSSCADIDECGNHTDTCGEFDHCENTVGSYTCNAFRSIAAGQDRTCALFENSFFKCWGRNQSAVSPPSFATSIGSDGLDAKRVFVGNQHYCALYEDNSVRCWGGNHVGQLGYGDTSSRAIAGAAINFGVGRTVIDMSTNGDHNCAVLDDHSLRCWGNNDNGLLGYGDTDPRYDASQSVDLGDGANAYRVVTGPNHTCAIIDDGAIKCWGSNYDYNLGYGDSTTRYAPPEDVIDVGTGGSAIAVDIAVTTTTNTCAVFDDGSIKCWGNNRYGVNGATAAYIEPPTGTRITFGSDEALSIEAGTNHVCAYVSDNSLRCWGGNNFGQLGDERPQDLRATVGTITPSTETITQFVLSGHYTCIVSNDEHVQCWGDNTSGSLGYGMRPRLLTPSLVTPFEGAGTITQLAMGTNATCALTSNHEVYCWGSSYGGTLGLGDLIDRNLASDPVDLHTAATPAFIRMGDGTHACAVFTDGRLKCWGYNASGELGYGEDNNIYMEPVVDFVDVGVGRTVLDVALGYNSTCALLDDGTVKCWGYNIFGTLGYGDTVSRNAPPAMPIDLQGHTATAIASGGYSYCVIRDDDQVVCWGRNDSGQLGYGDTIGRNAPPATAVDLGLGQSASALSLGSEMSCAKLASGDMKCWGGGYLGYGDQISRSAPISQTLDFGSATLTSMAVAEYGTCVLLGTNDVRCWGVNLFGQLGYGDSAWVILAPLGYGIDLPDGLDVVQLASNYGQACVLLSDNSVRCWGDNDNGQLGNAYGLYWSPRNQFVNLSGR